MTSGAPQLNVSRETLEKLTHYVALLEKWNPRINLVSRSTLPLVWDRHVRDSLQLLRISPENPGKWVDLGSGGGFPGLVAAIAGQEVLPDTKFVLVESDQRKCTFLRTVLRETGVDAEVIAGRIEEIPPLNADVVSARALADLSTLLGFVERHGCSDCVALFPKGVTWRNELTEAQRRWEFDVSHYRSETEPQSVILKIKGIARV